MQQNENNAQWEYGIYRENSDDSTHFPAIGDFTYYKSADYWECGRTRAKTSLFDLGRQGWEGFTTDYSGGDVFSILMKRRVQ